MKVYISGPISGLPDLNAPAFQAAEDLLRSDGHEPVNPLKVFQPRPEGYSNPEDLWLDAMKQDIQALIPCEAFCRLPGWESSRGAQLEVTIAQKLHKTEVALPPQP